MEPITKKILVRVSSPWILVFLKFLHSKQGQSFIPSCLKLNNIYYYINLIIFCSFKIIMINFKIYLNFPEALGEKLFLVVCPKMVFQSTPSYPSSR